MTFPFCSSAAQRLSRNSLFDADWYLNRYPDVQQAGIDPVTHYLHYGHRLQRDPGPNSSTRFARAVFHLDNLQEPLAALAKKAVRARPDRSRVLRAAAELAERDRPDLAASLARVYLPPHLSHTVKLLDANAQLNADRAYDLTAMTEWLRLVNDYLEVQNVAPVALTKAEERLPLIARLRPALVPVPITGGPKVSVIMPCWNAGPLVTMAAQSILGQSWRNLELLIVDDCSTDDSWARLERLAAGDARVRIMRNSVNLGPYVSKNIAVSQTTGSYITGHDADDWAHPDRIARQVRFCLERDEIACLSGMLRINPSGRFVRFNDIGGNVHDGACRSAFISLMVQAQAFHTGFGFWDAVRVAGDSEMIHRIEHIAGRPIPRIPVTTMFCLDSPHGLTNAETLGHSERGGVSPSRALYKKSFQLCHPTLDKLSARYDFTAKRRFRAPPEMLDSAQKIAAAVQDYAARGLHLRRRIEADVAIVTNLRFPGGNASSSLDEIRVFQAHGLRVALIHCPVTRDIARSISNRYQPHEDIITDWPRVESVRARCLIVRHPAVLAAEPFQRLVGRLHANHAFVVINNSERRADGRIVYDMAAMIATARRIDAPQLNFCPIGPLMRAELVAHAERTGDELPLTAQDWSPTLNPENYLLDPKPMMPRPLSIGRHGRDGAEKWHESAAVLREVYADVPHQRVVILGGAQNAQITLGRLPGNWTVHGFGEITPLEYLSGLDVFVYYPQSTLIEAFGRTVAEAMMASVPCILPPTLEPNFGELAFYARPAQVGPLIDALARDDQGRIAFLREVQGIVLDRFSSCMIEERLAETGLFWTAGVSQAAAGLSAEGQAWRVKVMAQAHRMVPA